MATQSRRRIPDKLVALQKIHVFNPTGTRESNELEADQKRMGCLGLLESAM
jgi:hypothetical protein